jgi:hypothetical protein
MKAWEEYALIVNGVVQSVGAFAIGGYTEANTVAREVYGKDALAVNVSQIPTAVGDTYRDGIFYHTDDEGIEKEVPVIATEEEAVSKLQTATEANASAIDDILVAILDNDSTAE